MKHDLNKAIGDIKAIVMTAEEKALMRARILKPVASPWRIYSFLAWIRRHGSASLVVAIILLVLLNGSTVALAAEGSLPGDILYPIKVNVVEPISGALKTTPEAKAAWAASLASTRLSEAEALAAQGRLNASNEQTVQAGLAAQTHNLQAALTSIPASQASTSARIASRFEADMNSHANTLQSLANASTAPAYGRTSLERRSQAPSLNVHQHISSSTNGLSSSAHAFTYASTSINRSTNNFSSTTRISGNNNRPRPYVNNDAQQGQNLSSYTAAAARRAANTISHFARPATSTPSTTDQQMNQNGTKPPLQTQDHSSYTPQTQPEPAHNDNVHSFNSRH